MGFMGYKYQSIGIVFLLGIGLALLLGVAMTTTSMGVIFFTGVMSGILTFTLLACTDLLGYTSVINIGLVVLSGTIVNPTFAFIFMAVLGIGFRGLGKAIRSISPSADMNPDERALFYLQELKDIDRLREVKTEAFVNLQVGSIFIIMLTIAGAANINLQGFATFLVPLSGLASCLMWSYYIYEKVKVQDKLAFVIGAIMSIFPIIISFMAFDGGNPALPVMAAFLFLFGNRSQKGERVEIKELDEINANPTPAGLRNWISSQSYLVGIISSVFIGVPRFVLGECIFPESCHKKLQHWISEAVSEYFGHILLFVYGMSRTGIADSIQRLDIIIPSDTFLFIGVVLFMILWVSYIYLETFLEIYSWINEGAISDNHLGDLFKVAFVFSTATNPLLALAFVAMGYFVNWTFTYCEIPITASMIGISALPAYFIFL